MIYIPTGTIHAIGAGVLLAEIQQSSDVTYRVYDYNRVDNKREKHGNCIPIGLRCYRLYDRKALQITYPKHLNKVNPVIDLPISKLPFCQFQEK